MSRSRHAPPTLALAAMLTALALPAAAGVDLWTPLGPDGAYVSALAVASSDPDVVYAGAHQAGVYKSTDGGGTWSFAGRGIGAEPVVDLAVDPRDAGIAYVAAETGAVFKTTDGAAWVRVWTGAPRTEGAAVPTFTLEIDARRPDTVFAGTGQGLYRSTDGGATWAHRGNLTGTMHSLAYDAAGGWLYAGVEDRGVFRSFNQGRTWERISSGLPQGLIVYSLAIDPDRPKTLMAGTNQGLYRSLDRGGRWQIVGGVPDHSATAIAFQGHGRVYAMFLPGIFSSLDNGATWRRSALLPGRTGGELRELAVGPDRVYAGLGTFPDPDGPGLYRSLDFGATFEPAVEGLPGLAVSSVAVGPSNPETIYVAVASSSLYKTTDGGATWTRRHLGLFGGGFYPISDVLIDPARPATLWLVGGSNPVALRSDDAGETWQALGGVGPVLQGIALDPRAPDALWGAGWGGIYHSADGGQTWEHRGPDGGGTLYLEEIRVDPRDPNVIYAAGASRVDVRPPQHVSAIFRSTDGGQTWERRDAGIQSGSVYDMAVDPTDSATLYATNGAFYRSTDAGLSWTPAPGLAGFAYVTIATAPAGPPGTPAAVCTARQLPAGLVLCSTDRGLTWTPLRRGLPPAIPHVLEVDPTNPAHLLLGTQNRSLLTYTLGGAAQ